MAEFSKLVITIKGQTLLAKMIAGSGNIEFTKVSAFSITYTDAQLKELTELSEEKQVSLVSKVTRTNEVAIKVEAAFTNAELVEGYYIKGLGLYAVDPDYGEILYAVTREVSGNCYMPAYNGVTVSGVYVQLVTTVGNAENVSLEVNQAAVATVGDIMELKKDISDLREFGNKNSVIVKKDIIIPVNGWSVTDEGKEGDMCIDIPLEGVTEDMTPIISILPTDMDKAKACELRNICRTMSGMIRLYAAGQPDAEIHAELVLLSEGSGISPGGSIGGGLENPSYTLPTATKTRLGGVRIGDGVAVGDDGTISVDAAGVLDGVAATDEDVITVLDSVFGETTP